MLDIYEMQIFLAAAEAGSFSEAGRRLQLSQPAVSMQIRSLEKRLDIELFHRAGRHIRLSEAGQALVPLARDLVNLSIHTEEAIASLKGEVIGVLKLGCSTTAGKYVLPKLIARFMEHYSEVQVVCTVGSRGTALQMLLEGHAQLAVTSLREPHKELEFRPFIVDPVVLITPPAHPWASTGTISLGDLADGQFVLREQTSGTHQAVADALTMHDISANSLEKVMVLGNSEAIIEAVAEGIGASFVSSQAAEKAITHRRVARVAVEGLTIEQQLYMARHAHRAATTAQSTFWDFVYLPSNRDLLEYSPLAPVRANGHLT